MKKLKKIELVDLAMDAFFTVVHAAHPSAEGNVLDPEWLKPFREAAKTAIDQWVIENVADAEFYLAEEKQ